MLFFLRAAEPVPCDSLSGSGCGSGSGSGSGNSLSFEPDSNSSTDPLDTKAITGSELFQPSTEADVDAAHSDHDQFVELDPLQGA